MSKNDANTQERTFLRWVNNHLSRHGVKLDSIHDLTKDGVPLVKLMLQLAHSEIESDPQDAKTVSKFESKMQKLSKLANMQPSNRPNFLQNCNICLEFLKDETKMIGIGAMDLVDGTNRNLLLGFLWTLILRFQIEKGKKGGTTAESELLQFLKNELGTQDVNFSKAWKGGKPLEDLCWKCSEFHEQKVEIQDKLVEIAKHDETKNTEMIHLAHDYYGVPELIDADDLAADEPDKLSLITYVSYFRDYIVKERGEVEQQKKEEEKNQEERLERERLEKERRERERLERERLEQERIEKERLERERLEQERLENERLENERLQREREERERLERERLEKERLEKERLERERLENERLEQERLEQERLQRERFEQDLVEMARLEKERLEKEEQQRLERERLERERLERERLEKEKLEKERLERERLERERLERERLEKEKQEKLRLEQERLERERLEKERLEKERLERERLEKERLAQQVAQGQDNLVLDISAQPPPAEPAQSTPKSWSIVDRVFYTTGEGFLAEDIAADVQCPPQEINTLFNSASKLVFSNWVIPKKLAIGFAIPLTIVNVIVSLMFFIFPWLAIIGLQQNGLYVGLAGCVLGMLLFCIFETILLLIIGLSLEAALRRTSKVVNSMLQKKENANLAENSYNQQFQIRYKFDTSGASFVLRFRATPSLEIYQRV